MFSKLGALVIKQLILMIPSLISRAASAFREYLDRRKHQKQATEAARKVEDAQNSNDLRDSIDDLP